MKPVGLAGTIAAAMTMAEKARAAMAAKALLMVLNDMMLILLFP
tara:strand:+ start:1795 stop:1926 length:132 start_codon:yes stop_codon:yes gene_type:complete